MVQPRQGLRLHPAPDGSKDVFVHITALQAAGISSLNDGQKVSFDVVTERGKQAAANLKLGRPLGRFALRGAARSACCQSTGRNMAATAQVSASPMMDDIAASPHFLGENFAAVLD